MFELSLGYLQDRGRNLRGTRTSGHKRFKNASKRQDRGHKSRAGPRLVRRALVGEANTFLPSLPAVRFPSILFTILFFLPCSTRLNC